MTHVAHPLLALALLTAAALPGIAHATCGDGVLDASEECDDLNTADNDGCDSSCMIEDGYECVEASFALDFAETITTVDPSHSTPSWTLSSDGTTITQSLNALPAVYVSTLPAVGVSMTFDLTVNTTSDDDYIGWAIGYDAGEGSSSTADWLLFDWKQGDQTWSSAVGYAGLRMYRVTGAIDDSYELWGHTDSVSEIAQGLTLGSTGWSDNTTYSVQVDYSTTQVDVYVDGTLEFSESGSWPTGNFGFYNFSQESIEYTLTAPLDQSVCAEADSDGDGITDLVEDAIGTDREDADSDGDGIDDLSEVVDTDDPVDSDGDGIIDAIDADDDDDGIDTIDEDLDADGDPTNDDSDSDGTPDYLDDDDDDDGVPTASEDYDGDGDPADNDADGDGDPDYLDTDSDDDGYDDASDCAPIDASVNPDATEICDGVDNDCDGTVDEDDASDASTWYADSDGDGYGDPGSTTTACSQPSGYVADDTDCDDGVASTYPGATEYCDGVDNDCDGTTDEDDAADASTWYADSDGDGFGDSTDSTQQCYQPSGYVSDGTDCDDGAASVYPGADEYCNGIDDDCDGLVDEGTPVDVQTWYADLDGDGYGDAGSTVIACTQPSGYVLTDTDCDDTDAAVFPGATEYCNGIDDDCDGNLDEPEAVDATDWYPDTDGDGYGDPAFSDHECYQPSGWVADNTDCDDTDAAVNPGQDELCNGIDDDCDGVVDESDAIDASTWYGDTDGDGFGDAASSVNACDQPSGYVADDTDCYDGDATINPDAEEIWYDGVDQDCDGASDYDQDGDGYDHWEHGGVDCDDEDDGIHPDAEEIWYDGVDQDCDGSSDYDRDGDGYDSETYGGDDCDDADADKYPGAPDDWYDGEIFDCDRTNDYDGDGDGFDSHEYGGEDCDDAASDVNPDAEEIWYDGVDQDCDGNDADQDGDGYNFDGDCDDTDADIYPGAPGWSETCEELTGDTDYLDTGAGKPSGDCGCSGAPAAAPAFALLLMGLVPLVRRRDP